MKVFRFTALLTLLACLSGCDDGELGNTPADSDQQPADSFTADSLTGCNTDKEQALIDTIQAYRLSRGLPEIPVSRALTVVADAHVRDLNENAPHKDDFDNCNLHSWSDSGAWSGCCYTDDHDKAECMWDKPSELTAYEGNGYEIALGASDITVTPGGAIRGWQKSPAHNRVILNKGQWQAYDWGAMGVSIKKGFAVVWFGQQSDQKGSPDACSQ